MGSVEVTASQWRLVEVGRVVLFVTGPYAGKLAAIAEIIDHKRVCVHLGGRPGGLGGSASQEWRNRRLTFTRQVLVDGPASTTEASVPRHSAPLSHVSLTRFVIDKLPRAAGTAAVKKQWEAQEIEKKFYSSDYAKKREQVTKRRNLNDFERFKVMRLRKQVSLEKGRMTCEDLLGWGPASPSIASVILSPSRSDAQMLTMNHRPVSRSARPSLPPRPRKCAFLETTIQLQPWTNRLRPRASFRPNALLISRVAGVNKEETAGMQLQ
jgi:large subunit ribosomal protein L14e